MSDEKSITILAAEMLAANWIELAASAWAGFKKHGRGAILNNIGVPGLKEGLTYIEPRVVQAIAEKANDNEMVDNVKEYDPKRELVFIYITQSGYSLYCGNGYDGENEVPAPPAAYEVAKEQGSLILG